MSPAKLSLSTLVGFFLASFSLLADPVDSLRALQTAQNFYITRQPDLSAAQKANLLFRLSQKRPLQNPRADKSGVEEFLYYVFNVGDNNGFVIVSADDAAHPILGYSTTGYFETENQPSHVASWMQTYASQLQEIKDKRLKATPEITREWQNIREGVLPAMDKAAVVGPLIATKWGQGSYYNNWCPPNDGSERSVTGCVATAMAQIIKYHNHPSRGSGFKNHWHSRYGTLFANFDTSYDWSSMPNSLHWYSSSTAINSVAKLMYHCGVSVSMNYDLERNGGSGIPSNEMSRVVFALKNYFNYSDGVREVTRSNYSDSDWINLIKNELNYGRPVEYHGIGSRGGHSFICDGYDSSGLFYFNWGWGGTSDGNYSINYLNPTILGTGGGAGGFNLSQGAIIGIAKRVNTAYNLQLYQPIQGSYTNGTLSVSLNLENKGSSSFQGDYAVAIFDNENKFIDFVEIKQNYGNLPPNSHYTNNLIFSKSIFLWPGKFYLASYYRESGGQWNGIGAGSYSNWVEMNLSMNPRNSMELYAPTVIIPRPAFATQPLNVTANFVNKGTATFNGTIELSLSKTDGSFVKMLETTPTQSLPVSINNYYTTIFPIENLDVEPGDYLLYLHSKPTGGTSSVITGTNTNFNPIRLQVLPTPLLADGYEPNNTVETAYKLTPTIPTGGTATLEITYPTTHVGNDVDLYEIPLDQNSNYLFKVNAHDRDYSTKGSFTGDIIFSHYTPQRGWTDLGNARASESVIVNNEDLMRLWVSPAYLGLTGTYQLDVFLARVPKISITPKTSLTQCNAPVVLEAPSGYGFYRWYRDGGFMTEIISTTYAAILTGNYTVEAGITTSNGRLVGPRSNAVSVLPFVTVAAPTASSATYTQNAVATSLTATGQNLRWYYTATSTQSYPSIAPSTSTTGTQTYYVTQTINDCESPRTVVVVTVTPSSSCILMATRKDGLWTDPTVWSCERVPVSTELVYVRHTVTIPVNQIARARRIIFGTGGKITSESLGRLQLGQ